MATDAVPAWREVTIGEIASSVAIGPFGSRLKSDLYETSGVPVVRGSNISDTRRLSGPFVFVSQRTADSLPNASLVPGDVFFPHRGAIGEVGIVGDEADQRMLMSTSLMRLSCNPMLAEPRFVYYYFRAPQGRAALLAHASTVGTPGIGQPLRSLRSISIWLPPVEEQRQIAAVASMLDDKIEGNRRLIMRLTALLREAYLGAVLGVRAATTLGALGTVVGGDTPRSSVVAFWEPSEIAWVTPRDMTALTGNPCVWHGERWISRAGLASSSAKLVPRGSVLYTSRATLGLVAIAQRELATNQGFITLVPRDGLSSAFVFSTLLARSDAIRAKANGATFLEVNKTNFKQVECPMPGAERLAVHDSIATPVVDAIAGLAREANALIALRDAVLPKLVSGQIRVPLSNDPEEQVGAAVEALA